MSLLQRVFVSLFFFGGIHGSTQVSTYEPPCFSLSSEKLGTCLEPDLDPSLCSIVIKALGALSPLNAGITAVQADYGMFEGMILPISYTFQSGAFDFSTERSGANYIILYVFNPNTNEIQNIPLSLILLADGSVNCLPLIITGANVLFGVNGYTNGCGQTDQLNDYIGMNKADWHEYSNRMDTTVILVDWGHSGLACEGYPQLALCFLYKIAHLVAEVLYYCIVKVVTNVTLIGHSFGSQIIGYSAQILFLEYRYKVYLIIVSDPAGPLFTGMGIRCQVYLTEYATTVIVLHCSPNLLGTNNFCIGTTILLINPHYFYIQPGSAIGPVFHPGKCHKYCVIVVALLLKGYPLTGFIVSGPDNIVSHTSVDVTIYGAPMPYGYITVDTYNATNQPPPMFPALMYQSAKMLIGNISQIQEAATQIIKSKLQNPN